MAEFWRRWHISLTAWFKDYVFYPLGGNGRGTLTTMRNTFIIFLLSGLWHGANWTYIAWGAFNAVFILPSLLFRANKRNVRIVAQGRLVPSLKDVYDMGSTFLLMVFSSIFFRAESVPHAFQYIGRMFSVLFTKASYVDAVNFVYYDPHCLKLLFLIPAFLLVEWIGRENKHALENISLRWPKAMRWSFYYVLVFLIFLFTTKGQEFVYFQF
jgi:alginate O-acetyltransferase complex protein AlgI